jgi:hypothetical protein
MDVLEQVVDQLLKQRRENKKSRSSFQSLRE